MPIFDMTFTRTSELGYDFSKRSSGGMPLSKTFILGYVSEIGYKLFKTSIQFDPKTYNYNKLVINR